MKKSIKTHPNDNVFAYVNDEGVSYSGLTKREYFAALAMQGLLANAFLMETTIGNAKTEDIEIGTAKQAVAIADALITELNKDQ